MTRTVAVASQKGGVGKTTTVASLGAALVQLDQRVLLVDLDPQACLTFALGIDPEDLARSVHDVLVGRLRLPEVVVRTEEGMDLAPATIELASAEAALLLRGAREHALDDALGDVRAGYDWILLDCPPTLGILTVNALTAADEVLVPLQCETLAHRGVGQLVETVREVARTTNPRLRVAGILPTMYDGRTTHARAVLADIQQRYDVPVLEPPIPRTVRFAEAPAVGRSVITVAPSSRGAQAYREHARRLVDSAVEGRDARRQSS
jgi:chromosome partitioning protein